MRRQDHVATGWTEDRNRWIEVGYVRLVEDDHGATAFVLAADVVRQGGCDAQLSAGELAALARHLAGWFAEDPSDAINEIEARAKKVRDDLEAWNARARIDEEHPPYDDLTRSLDRVIARCQRLREDVGKFTLHDTSTKP